MPGHHVNYFNGTDDKTVRPEVVDTLLTELIDQVLIYKGDEFTQVQYRMDIDVNCFVLQEDTIVPMLTCVRVDDSRIDGVPAVIAQ